MLNIEISMIKPTFLRYFSAEEASNRATAFLGRNCVINACVQHKRTDSDKKMII